MSQTFEYPNLLIGSRSGVGWTYDHGSFDAYNHHCLFNDSKNENYMCSPLYPLKHGITYAFSAFSANTENFMGSDIYVLYAGGYSIGDGWIAGHMGFMKGPGGWVTYTYSLPSTSPEGNYYLRFDNNGSTDGKTSLIWLENPMLCIASEPHAWAPAEGEVWP